MLFLYRPRQTWMPFATPRERMHQAAYNRRVQDEFAATRRVAPVAPSPSATVRNPITDLEDLARLHDAGALTDAEFAAAKAKILDGGPGTP